MNKLRAILLPETTKWYFWLGLAFITRLIFFLLVMHYRQYDSFEGFWGGTRLDTSSYIDPCESFVCTHIYNPDFRMPGYAFIYIPIRMLFSKVITSNILIVIQFLFSTLSVYALALLAKNLFKNSAFFYITFYLYVISSFSSLMDTVLLTESLATSTLILSVYCLSAYLSNYKNIYLFLSGFLLTWGIFLHPVFCPFILLMVFLLIIHLVKYKQRFIKTIIIFLIPFTLIDGAWMIHNYRQHQKIAPLTTSVLFPWIENSYMKDLVSFGKSWGGGIWFVNPDGNDLSWFAKSRPHTDIEHDSVPFPKYIYTSAFNEDSLRNVKRLILRSTYDTSLSVVRRKELEKEAGAKIESYITSIRKEKPYLFYIQSNLHRLHDFLFYIHPVSKLFINNKVTYFYNSYYFFTLFAGIVGMLLLIPAMFKFLPESIVSVIPVYIILIHPFYIQYTENRYLIPAYPFIIVCATYAIIYIKSWILGRKPQQQEK